MKNNYEGQIQDIKKRDINTISRIMLLHLIYNRFVFSIQRIASSMIILFTLTSKSGFPNVELKNVFEMTKKILPYNFLQRAVQEEVSIILICLSTVKIMLTVKAVEAYHPCRQYQKRIESSVDFVFSA